MHLGETFYSDEDLKKAGFKKLGKNVKIKKNVGIFFTENIEIGDNVRIDDFTIIVASGPICRIGSYVHIASLCYIAGSAGFEMEDFSGLSPNVLMFTGSDDYAGNRLTNPTVAREYIGGKQGFIRLERHVIIGAGSVILPNVTIGIGSSIGSLSLVTKSLDPWGMYAGIPVRRLRDRSKKILEVEEVFLKSRQ